jgi:hypothetical protein
MIRQFDTEPILTKSRCKKFHSLLITYIMNLNRILLIIFATLSLQISFAQSDFKPGHIVTLEGDTLIGSINLKSNMGNGEQCEFKGENGETHIYHPFEIKEYQITNLKFYVSKSIPSEGTQKNVFLEYLVNGIADLYYLHEKGRDYFYIEKDGVLTLLSNDVRIIDNGLVAREVNTKAYIGSMKYLFNDSPEVLKKINAIPYAYKSLVKITKDYHHSVCSDYECIDYTKSTSMPVHFELYTSLTQSYMSNRSSDHSLADSQFGIGANLRFTPFRSHYLLNYFLGAHYSSCNFSGALENLEKYGPKSYKMDVQYNSLKIPLMIQYSLPMKKIKPFFMLGFENVLLLNYNIHVLRKYYDWDDSYSSAIDVTQEEQKGLKKHQIGFLAGVGARYQLSKNNYFFIVGNYEYRKPTRKTGYMLDYQYVQGLQINFGYGFKL